MRKDKKHWECSLKASSLFPSEEKRLDSAFALPASSRKPCPLSLHTTFFTAYLIANFVQSLRLEMRQIEE